MNTKSLRFVLIIMAVMTGAVFSVRAEATGDVRHESGEITWVDLKLGKLQLRSDLPSRKGDIFEYRITENETRVTDPTDRKLLTVDNLWPGQHVKIDVVKGEERTIVQKVTVDRNKQTSLQLAYGKVKSIDATGTLVLTERSKTGDPQDGALSYYVFDPKKIVVMQSPSPKPVELLVKPGDIVKVAFVLKDKKQRAQSVTLYSPVVTKTTTTTVTTTMTR